MARGAGGRGGRNGGKGPNAQPNRLVTWLQHGFSPTRIKMPFLAPRTAKVSKRTLQRDETQKVSNLGQDFTAHIGSTYVFREGFAAIETLFVSIILKFCSFVGFKRENKSLLNSKTSSKINRINNSILSLSPKSKDQLMLLHRIYQKNGILKNCHFSNRNCSK